MNARLITNVVAFQLGWFACVWGGGNALPWLGTIAAVVILLLHLRLSARASEELKLIGALTLIGTLWESALVAAGLLSYPSGMVAANAAPHWMAALWLMFATTLNVSLRWLKQRWWLSAVLGAVSGPASFFAGERLGAVSIAQGAYTWTTLAIGWAILLPFAVWLSTRWDGNPVSAR
jgi:hypothetical protein